MVFRKNSFKILVLPGDGVGPEVIAEALKVLQAVSEASNIEFDISEALFGGCSIDVHGIAITDEVMKSAREADAVLAGAVGGPKWLVNHDLQHCILIDPRGTGKIRPEEGLLQLRHGLQAYANLRPCRFASKSLHHLSALPHHVVDGTDFVIVRENCGGAYFGTKVEEEDFASDSWAYSRTEVERISHVAASLALEHSPPLKVISSDKANVLASSRLWRRVVSETFARHYPQITLSHQLADSAAMMMMRNPKSFNGILLTDNTYVMQQIWMNRLLIFLSFGDILSDEASVIPGSLGLLPSASLSGVPADGVKVKGFYEPVHGSAPDIAGRGQFCTIVIRLRV